MNINQAYPSKYITAPDLQNRAVTVTIARAIQEKMPDGKVLLVVYFQGTDRGMTLNKTNAMTIGSLHGPETDSWVGKRIQLYPTTTEWPKGRTIPCIRIQAAGVHIAPPQAAFPSSGPDINGELDDAADADQDMPPYDPDNPDAVPF